MEKQLEGIASSVFTGERYVDFSRLTTIRVNGNEHEWIILKFVLLCDLTCEPDLSSFTDGESIRFIFRTHTTKIFSAKNF